MLLLVQDRLHGLTFLVGQTAQPAADACAFFTSDHSSPSMQLVLSLSSFPLCIALFEAFLYCEKPSQPQASLIDCVVVAEVDN